MDLDMLIRAIQKSLGIDSDRDGSRSCLKVCRGMAPPCPYENRAFSYEIRYKSPVYRAW